MTPKLILGSAITVGCCIAGTASAGADPDPYAGLHCSCPEKAAAGSVDSTEAIERGLRDGQSARLPGLPPPVQAGRPPR